MCLGEQSYEAANGGAAHLPSSVSLLPQVPSFHETGSPAHPQSSNPARWIAPLPAMAIMELPVGLPCHVVVDAVMAARLKATAPSPDVFQEFIDIPAAVAVAPSRLRLLCLMGRRWRAALVACSRARQPSPILPK